MTTYHVVKVLPYSPEQMFALVGEVERYPDFLPWVNALAVEGREVAPSGAPVVIARMSVGFSFLRESFTTRVERDAERLRIDVALVSGPFRRLSNSWLFRPHPSGCEIVFDIDYQFRARVLDLVAKANLGFAVDQLIRCFEDRARSLYGAPLRGGRASAPAPS